MSRTLHFACATCDEFDRILLCAQWRNSNLPIIVMTQCICGMDVISPELHILHIPYLTTAASAATMITYCGI